MDRFEYVIGLLSIITGLALADIGVSLHRLMKRRSAVRWDWLIFVIAAYVSFVIIRYWYQVWAIRDFAYVTNLFFFLSIIAENFLLFLLAASVLPDEDDFHERHIDLRAYQATNSTYVWRLFLAYVLLWAIHGISFSAYVVTPWRFFVFFVPVLLGAVLAVVRNRPAQIISIAGLIAHEAIWQFNSNF